MARIASFLRLFSIIPILIIIVIVTVVVMLSEQKNDWEVANTPLSGTEIIAFGDSLIRGVGAKTDGGFVAILSDQVGIEITNRGVSGDTTASALERLARDVLDNNPDLVIVLLGGNDRVRQVSPEKTFGNLEEIITAIHDTGAAVLLLGVQGGVLRDPYEDQFRELAEEHQTGYVPNVLDGIFGEDEYMSDRIHPNEAGYTLIADKVEPELRTLLDR